MNWEQIEGQWKQFKGKVKTAWAKLSDDDIELLNGRRDVLIGKIQERYGVAKAEADKQVDAWMVSQSGPPPVAVPGPNKASKAPSTGHFLAQSQV